jgi:hypothetical protein
LHHKTWGEPRAITSLKGQQAFRLTDPLGKLPAAWSGLWTICGP